MITGSDNHALTSRTRARLYGTVCALLMAGWPAFTAGCASARVRPAPRSAYPEVAPPEVAQARTVVSEAGPGASDVRSADTRPATGEHPPVPSSPPPDPSSVHALDAITAEPGSDRPTRLPDETPLPRRPARPDPGALAVAGMLLDAADRSMSCPPDRVRIVIGAVQNRSRSTAAEAEAARMRLTHVLDRALRAMGGAGVVLLAGDPPAQDGEDRFRLDWTAYLVTVGGSDQWELYGTLRPWPAGRVIWRNEEPIRLLRSVRPRGPVITRWPGSEPPPTVLGTP